MTYNQPSTEPDSTMDQPGAAPTDNDPTQAAPPQDEPTVDPKATRQAPFQLPVKAGEYCRV